MVEPRQWRLMSRPNCGYSAVSGAARSTSQVVRRRCLSLGNSRCRRDPSAGSVTLPTVSGARKALGRVVVLGTRSSRTTPAGGSSTTILRDDVGYLKLVCLLIVAVPLPRESRCAVVWHLGEPSATTLAGTEIITAKMLGAVCKTRFGIALLLALWSAWNC